MLALLYFLSLIGAFTLGIGAYLVVVIWSYKATERRKLQETLDYYKRQDEVLAKARRLFVLDKDT